MDKIRNQKKKIVEIIIAFIFGVLALPIRFWGIALWMKVLYLVIYIGIFWLIYSLHNKKKENAIHFSYLSWCVSFIGCSFLYELFFL